MCASGQEKKNRCSSCTTSLIMGRSDRVLVTRGRDSDSDTGMDEGRVSLVQLLCSEDRAETVGEISH
jgi:hypothetical protein